MRFVRHYESTLLSVRGSIDLNAEEHMDISETPKRYRPTYINIDLEALESNFRALSDLVKPSKVAVAVKSNAYGHGIFEISQKLASIGVDILCVATAEEALLLRRKNISTPILLLSEPPIEAIGPCYLNDITFSVYTVDVVNAIAAVATSDRRAHVHLKVNTGMNRVGIAPSDSLTLARHISKHDSLFFEGISTHFATADEPTHPGAASQLEKFEKVLDDIELAGITPPLIHAANSAAAINIPSSRFSMVRVGIAQYGIYPEPRAADIISLKPVLSLHSAVSFLKTIQPGEAVSYGGRFVAEKETRIATIPIGYGDGVPRNLGMSGGSVLMYGVRCPIVGRVTMDQLMVDVGAWSVEVGDKVTLIGTQVHVSISAT